MMAYQQTNAKEKVLKLISENKVIIFSKVTCPFCDKVKALLDQNNISYKVIQLDKEEGGVAMHEALK